MSIMMTYLCTTFATAGPVTAGVVPVIGKIRGAVILGSGQDIVLVGFVIATFDTVTRLVECCLQRDGHIVKVQVRGVGSNQNTPRVVPGTITNSIP